MVKVLVYLPRLQVQGWVNFVIDTGADATTLHLTDSRNLFTNYDQLTSRRPARGVGQVSSSYAVEQAALVFRDTDGEFALEALDLLYIGLHGASSPTAPSLLGRDI